MDSNKHPNEARSPSPTQERPRYSNKVFQARKPTPTLQKPKDTGKPSANANFSTKTAHGSLTSGSRSGSAGHGDHGANSGNSQHENAALQKWLEQTPRDEPWRPGSRKA